METISSSHPCGQTTVVSSSQSIGGNVVRTTLQACESTRTIQKARLRPSWGCLRLHGDEMICSDEVNLAEDGSPSQ